MKSPKYSIQYEISGISKTYEYPKTFKTFKQAETKADTIIGQIHVSKVTVFGMNGSCNIPVLVRS